MSSIKMMTMVLMYLKLFAALYVMIVGSYFLNDINIAEAFGIKFKEIGSVLIFLSVTSAFVLWPHRWATDRHNRFVIFLSWCLDTMVFSVQIYLGYTVLQYTYPLFPKILQLDCLLYKPQIYSEDACAAYINSDRVSGFRLFWAYYFTDRHNVASFQVISNLEGDLCCGFFAPSSCIPNTNPFPADRVLDEISSDLTAQRVTCGPIETYYPNTDQCLHYFDIGNGIIGGCDYDMGLGYCLDRTVEASSTGCASTVEDYMALQIEGPGILLMGLTIFNIWAMLLQCCVWWKRKESDVFPKFEVDMGTDPRTNFNLVPDQFEVRPKFETLARQKFLPMPKYLVKELERIKQEEERVRQQKIQEEKDNQIEDDL
jgi:hypothetical protein